MRYKPATLSPSQQERSILLTGTMLLLCMGIAGALTTCIIFASAQQKAIQNTLQAELIGQTRLADAVIKQAANETISLIKRPLLSTLINEVASKRNANNTRLFQKTFSSLVSAGFSSLSIRWTDGLPELTVGAAATPV